MSTELSLLLQQFVSMDCRPFDTQGRMVANSIQEACTLTDGRTSSNLIRFMKGDVDVMTVGARVDYGFTNEHQVDRWGNTPTELSIQQLWMRYVCLVRDYEDEGQDPVAMLHEALKKGMLSSLLGSTFDWVEGPHHHGTELRSCWV